MPKSPKVKKFESFFCGLLAHIDFCLYICTRNTVNRMRGTVVKLSYGVTGNTSVFGTEESRFEP